MPATDPILRQVVKGAVSVADHRFGCPELADYDYQTVQVAWDDSDQDRQVWVGDLEGKLIGVATRVAQIFKPEEMQALIHSKQVEETAQIGLRILWKAGGELSMLELLTRMQDEIGSHVDLEQMLKTSEYEPTDIVRLTHKGMEAISQ